MFRDKKVKDSTGKKNKTRQRRSTEDATESAFMVRSNGAGRARFAPGSLSHKAKQEVWATQLLVHL